MLSRTEEMILSAVCAVGANAYGISIRSHLKDALGKPFSVGAVYVPLERLVKKGFLTSSLGESSAKRGGKRKRFYRITAQGVDALREIREFQASMWAGMSPLETLKPQST